MEFKHTYPVQLRFSDVDVLGHVNNSVYFSLYDLAKTAYMQAVRQGEDAIDYRRTSMVVANLNANFFAPVFFSDRLAIQTSAVHLGNKSFVLYQRAICEDTGEVKCECRTVMVAFDVASQQAVPIPREWKEAICRFEGKTPEELKRE